MELVCTTCSKRKRRAPGLLPARHRYLSKRIRYVLSLAEHGSRLAAILSGRYGLLAPDDRIPWYDQVLAPDGVEVLLPRLIEQLRSLGATSAVFYAQPPSTAGWEPYHEALEQACRRLGIRLEVRLLNASLP
ncbi:MAG TPA: hypothetical protein VK845_05605 [Gemmatimonadales bacterium]|nr:hypothetical protein [Gemmatimonadales bacterium]